MPLNNGDRYAPGSGRRYVITPSGDRITRAQSENNFARRMGFSSNYEYKRASARDGSRLTKSTRYQRDRDAARARGLSDREFRALATRLSTAPRDARGLPVDKSPDGPLARYNTATGRRPAGADYAVGESPGVK